MSGGAIMIEDGFVPNDGGVDNGLWADETDNDEDLTEIKEDDWPTDTREGMVKLVAALDYEHSVSEIPTAAEQWLEDDLHRLDALADIIVRPKVLHPAVASALAGVGSGGSEASADSKPPTLPGADESAASGSSAGVAGSSPPSTGADESPAASMEGLGLMTPREHEHPAGLGSDPRDPVHVRRSFRLMQALVGGRVGATRLLAEHGLRLGRSLLRVFSDDSRGSFRHACSVLYRIVQAHPELSVELLSTAFRRPGGEDEAERAIEAQAQAQGAGEGEGEGAGEGEGEGEGEQARKEKEEEGSSGDGETAAGTKTASFPGREEAAPARVGEAEATKASSAAGRLLRFIHHPAVGDALLQLATCNHRASHAGGAGAQAGMGGQGAAAMFGGAPQEGDPGRLYSEQPARPMHLLDGSLRASVAFAADARLGEALATEVFEWDHGLGRGQGAREYQQQQQEEEEAGKGKGGEQPLRAAPEDAKAEASEDVVPAPASASASGAGAGASAGAGAGSSDKGDYDGRAPPPKLRIVADLQEQDEAGGIRSDSPAATAGAGGQALRKGSIDAAAAVRQGDEETEEAAVQSAWSSGDQARLRDVSEGEHALMAAHALHQLLAWVQQQDAPEADRVVEPVVKSDRVIRGLVGAICEPIERAAEEIQQAAEEGKEKGEGGSDAPSSAASTSAGTKNKDALVESKTDTELAAASSAASTASQQPEGPKVPPAVARQLWRPSAKQQAALKALHSLMEHVFPETIEDEDAQGQAQQLQAILRQRPARYNPLHRHAVLLMARLMRALPRLCAAMAHLHELLHPGTAAAVVRLKKASGGGSGSSSPAAAGGSGKKKRGRRSRRRRTGGDGGSKSGGSTPSKDDKDKDDKDKEGKEQGASVGHAEATAGTMGPHAVHHPGHVVNVPFGSLRLGVMRLVAAVVERKPRSALERCSGEGAAKEATKSAEGAPGGRVPEPPATLGGWEGPGVWGACVVWLLEYQHSTMWHNVLERLVRAAVQSRHGPTLERMVSSGRMAYALTQLYVAAAPPYSPAGWSMRVARACLEGVPPRGSSKARELPRRPRGSPPVDVHRLRPLVRAADSLTKRLPRSGRSSAQGVTRRILNMIRLAGEAKAFSSEVERYLGMSEWWAAVQDLLLADSYEELRPLVRAPRKQSPNLMLMRLLGQAVPDEDKDNEAEEGWSDSDGDEDVVRADAVLAELGLDEEGEGPAMGGAAAAAAAGENKNKDKDEDAEQPGVGPTTEPPRLSEDASKVLSTRRDRWRGRLGLGSTLAKALDLGELYVGKDGGGSKGAGTPEKSPRVPPSPPVPGAGSQGQRQGGSGSGGGAPGGGQPGGQILQLQAALQQLASARQGGAQPPQRAGATGGATGAGSGQVQLNQAPSGRAGAGLIGTGNGASPAGDDESDPMDEMD